MEDIECNFEKYNIQNKKKISNFVTSITALQKKVLFHTMSFE